MIFEILYNENLKLFTFLKCTKLNLDCGILIKGYKISITTFDWIHFKSYIFFRNNNKKHTYTNRTTDEKRKYVYRNFFSYFTGTIIVTKMYSILCTCKWKYLYYFSFVIVY